MPITERKVPNSQVKDLGTTTRVINGQKYTEQNLEIVDRKGCSPKLLIPAAIAILGIAAVLALNPAVQQFVSNIVGK